MGTPEPRAGDRGRPFITAVKRINHYVTLAAFPVQRQTFHVQVVGADLVPVYLTCEFLR